MPIFKNNCQILTSPSGIDIFNSLRDQSEAKFTILENGLVCHINIVIDELRRLDAGNGGLYFEGTIYRNGSVSKISGHIFLGQNKGTYTIH